MFISFEGIDFSGKSTQLARLVPWFERHGHPVLLVREPGGTSLSERIRALLLGDADPPMDVVAEMLLFSAARAQLVRERVVPALEAGTAVLADRFHDSTTAYQGYGRGIDPDAIRRVQRLATHGVSPDLTLYFDIDPRECARRRASAGRGVDRMESADTAFFTRVREGYLLLAREEADRIVSLDGARPPDALERDIRDVLRRRFAECHDWSDA
jgi:dTMP kinase